jgi:hypothetical protein
MIPTGVIFAVLDCDADAVEAFNRWYDLEHVPPNVWLAGVMLGQRYVAPPELHAVRVAAAGSPFDQQRGTFLTIYTLCVPPAEAMATMTTVRDKLYAEGRMRFPAEKKTVRDGDAMSLVGAMSSDDLGLPAEEVPFLGHTGLVVVQRRGDEAVSQWYRTEWAKRVVAVEGVHGVMTLRSLRRAEDETDLVFIEGDAVQRTNAVRAAAPHHPDAEVLVDGPYLRIEPLNYPWADAIARSDLPSTVA